MAAWSYSHDETCKQCGAVHRLESMSIGMRDDDSINCKTCGEKLYAWNGGVTFEATLTKPGKISKKKK